jgi:hypothetical protein
MEDTTNRGLITAIVIILIVLVVIWLIPRRATYVEPSVIRREGVDLEIGTKSVQSTSGTSSSSRTTTTTTTTYPGTTEYSYEHNSSQGQVCTQEALRCPDGTYVGRTGPICSFAPCL